MKISRLGLSGLLLICMACVFMSASASPEWKVFTSNYFSLRYPASWRRIKSDTGFLHIVNFSPSAEVKGLLIPPGGADIVARELQEHYSSIDERIESNNRFGGKIINRQVIKQLNKKAGTCAQLVEVVRTADIALPARVIQTTYYCLMDGHLFIVGVSNWQWDSRQKQLQALALKIARSLRVSL